MPTVRQLKKATALRAEWLRIAEQVTRDNVAWFKDDRACIYFWRAHANARYNLDRLARNEGDERDGRNDVAWARHYIRLMAKHARIDPNV